MDSSAVEEKGGLLLQTNFEEQFGQVTTAEPHSASKGIERLMELSFVNSGIEEKDQSSFGLLPNNLMFDFTSMNSSTNSLSFLMNKSRKYSCLPSIPESPKQVLSPTKTVQEKDSENVARIEDKEAVKPNTVVPGQFASQKCGAKFSISDISKIEFCDDQISARSSTANTYDLNSGLQPSDINDTSMPSTFSHLFSRHSLDVSAFTASLAAPMITPADRTMPSKQKLQTVSNTELVRDEQQHISSMAFDNPESDKNCSQFFYSLGNEHELHKNLSQSNDEFIRGVDALSLFEKDEKVHINDNFLLLPPVSNEEINDTKLDQKLESSLGSSWLANMNRQDITRPSWFTSEDESRISIGKFLGARTEDVEALGDEQLYPVNVPSGEPDAIKLQDNELEALSTKVNNSFRPVLHQKDVVTPSIKSENILSNSAISMLISDASINASPNELAKLFLKAAFLLKRDSCDNSGSSTPASFFENGHSPGSTSKESIPDEISKLGLELANRMEDKIVQVSLEARNASPVTPGNVPTYASLPLAASISLPSSVANVSLPSAACVSLPSAACVSLPSAKCNYLPNSNFSQGDSLLKPLRSDPQDSKPTVVLPSSIEMDICCVGASVEYCMPMQNLSARWLESSMLIQKLTCNGQCWDLETTPPIIRITPLRAIEPQSVNNVKIVLIPPTEGCWEAILQFFFRNLSSSSGTVSTNNSPVIDWCSYPPICLTAKAESPSISVVPDDVVDFGMLPEECLSMNQIQLSNNGKCKVPVRLVMEGSPVAGQGFYFPQERALPSSNVMQVLSTCLSNCVLQSCLGEPVKIPIAFKAPTLSHTGDDTRAFSACLRIELDTPGPAPTLRKVLLRAIVGVVKLYTRPEDDTMNLTFPSSTTKTFPLRNAGAVSVNVVITPEDSQRLTVVPTNIALMPGEETPVQVTFHPSDIYSPLQSFLKIEVLPSGPVYKISVNGSYQPNHASHLAASGDHSALYSNRRYIYYGAANLGQSLEQRIILRNVSVAGLLNLNIKIKVDDANNDGTIFMLKNESVNSVNTNYAYKLVLQTYVTLCPGDEHSLVIVFAPKAVIPYSAKLIIRPQRGTQVKVGSVIPGVKFSVPLRGYGGIAVLSCSGLNPTDRPSPSQLSLPFSISQPFSIGCHLHPVIQEIVLRSDQQVVNFGLRNTGHRAAFLRILLLQDTTSLLPVPSNISATVNPTSYVLPEQQSISVKISAIIHAHNPTPFYALVIYGEEVLRQRFRMLSPQPTKCIEDCLLRDHLYLHETFFNESPLISSGSQVSDPLWPSCQSDRSELFSSLKFLWIRVQVTSSVGGIVPSQQTTDIPIGTFLPLVAEATFSDVTFMPSHRPPPSPPIKEKSPLPTGERFILVEPTIAIFPRTSCGSSTSVKITLKNIGCDHNLSVGILRPANPFHISHSQVTIKPKHYVSLPVFFRPKAAGMFSSSLLLHPQLGTSSTTLAVSLQAEAF